MVRGLSVCFGLLGLLAGLASRAEAQARTLDTLCAEQIEKASPAIALVLVRETSSKYNVGTAAVLHENGILLTAYHLIENAHSVQVRLKNGVTFNQVQLLGVDRERDVAAIRIPAVGLPVLPVVGVKNAKGGDPICIVPDGAARPWTVWGGMFVSHDLAWRMELADDLVQPDTNLMEVWVDANAASGGGIVLDSQGRVLGMLVGRLQGKGKIAIADPFSLLFEAGQALVDIQSSTGYAVPAGDVSSLAEAPLAQSFESGSKLRLLGELRDGDFILRNFRALFVDARRAKWFGSKEISSALGNNSEFCAMGIDVVDDPDFADVVLEVSHTYLHKFAWEYPFLLRHQNTGIVVLSGKGVAPQPGPSGAASTTKELIRRLVPYRRASTQFKQRSPVFALTLGRLLAAKNPMRPGHGSGAGRKLWPVLRQDCARSSLHLPVIPKVSSRLEGGSFARLDRAHSHPHPGYKESAFVIRVSAHGGLLELSGLLQVGDHFMLRQVNRNVETECRVVSVQHKAGKRLAGFEFTAGLVNFWGISFPAPDAKPAYARTHQTLRWSPYK